MTRTALVVLLSVAGCTSDNPDLGDGSTADQAAVGDQAGPGPTDGGAADQRGGGDGAVADTRINPVDPGRTWDYAVALVGAGYMTCPAGNSQIVAGKAAQLGGRTAVSVTSFCKGIQAVDVSVVGDKTDVYLNGAWTNWLDTPAEGKAWTYANSSWKWKRSAAVKVPAGMFDDCWTAVQVVSYSSENTYCRGVGLVRSYLKDLAGNGWDAQLTKKSF